MEHKINEKNRMNAIVAEFADHWGERMVRWGLSQSEIEEAMPTMLRVFEKSNDVTLGAFLAGYFKGRYMASATKTLKGE